MTTRTYSILAGVLGSVLGAWWYMHRRSANSVRSRGTVIYDNTPTPTALSTEGLM